MPQHIRNQRVQLPDGLHLPPGKPGNGCIAILMSLLGSGDGSVAQLHKAGKIKKEDATELRYVVAGMAEGRKSDDTLVTYCSLGLGAMDIIIAYQLYKNAKEKGLGTVLNLWDAPLYV